MNRAFLVTFCMVGIVAWAACDSTLHPTITPPPAAATAQPISKWVDAENGVVCYTNTTTKPPVMFCLKP